MADGTATIDLKAVTERQQKVWATGDFAAIGATITLVGELLAEAVPVRPGDTVLDVATGSGNTAIAAARRFAEVSGVDFVPALLERGRLRAQAEGLSIEFREGDAQAIPYPDASFDVALSTFGVMFAPDQERAAAELLRVTRPGGSIGLASWTPESFIGDLFRANGKHVPPPAGLKPPGLWGTEARLRELFGNGISELRATRREVVFRYRSPEHWLDYWRSYYGPTIKTFEALDDAGKAALERDLLDLAAKHNADPNGTLAIPSEYLEVVATRAL